MIESKLCFVLNPEKATGLMYTSTKIANRLRIKYFESILRQDVGYFDVNSAAELNTRLFNDIKKVQDGVGDKLGLAIAAAGQFIGGIAIGEDLSTIQFIAPHGPYSGTFFISWYQNLYVWFRKV